METSSTVNLVLRDLYGETSYSEQQNVAQLLLSDCDLQTSYVEFGETIATLDQLSLKRPHSSTLKLLQKRYKN